MSQWFSSLGFHNSDAIQEIEKKGIIILHEEKVELKKVHRARNYAQHRAVIPNSIWTREYMNWIYKFMKRFCQENFNVNIDDIIPSHMRNEL